MRKGVLIRHTFARCGVNNTSHNTGVQDRPLSYLQRGVVGKGGGPRVCKLRVCGGHDGGTCGDRGVRDGQRSFSNGGDHVAHSTQHALRRPEQPSPQANVRTSVILAAQERGGGGVDAEDGLLRC